MHINNPLVYKYLIAVSNFYSSKTSSTLNKPCSKSRFPVKKQLNSLLASAFKHVPTLAKETMKM